MLTSTVLIALGLTTLAAADKVNYKTLITPRGDHLPDFSYCGYRASNTSLPPIDSPPTRTLHPSSGDQTVRVQDALNSISKKGGGVLLLTNGQYKFQGSLVIPNNTVLRGSGTGKTTLLPVASSDFIVFGDEVDDPEVTPVSKITDKYVAVGANKFTVNDASGLQVGQYVMVQRAATADWIRQNGMADLVRDGKPQTWLKPGSLIEQPRRIIAIANKQITIDVPLTDAIDSRYMQGQVAPYAFPKTSSEMGIESLSITLSPTCSGASLADSSCGHSAITFNSWVTDSWIRNVNITGYNGYVNTLSMSQRITIDSLSMYRDHATNKSRGYPADITIQGTQILVKDSSSFGVAKAQTFPVVTQDRTPGPNAVVNFSTELAISVLSPHQRWAHGLLIDNSKSSWKLGNRGIYGSGQGWTINAGVAWNVDGDTGEASSPPLGTNWCIGCGGDKVTGNGTFVSRGKSVEPLSLFAAQLNDRIRK